MKKAILIILSLFMVNSFLRAQSIDSLRQRISEILKDKSVTAGIAIKGPESGDTLSINGNKHLPMQSVFKYHLALAVLHQVDLGKLSLDDQILIEKDLIKKYEYLWSPLRKKYPEGAKVTLAEILKYTVSLSDNLGCDLLFELIGGTKVVQSYLKSIGIHDIAIRHNEIVMQSEWKNQYDNWTTANAANQLLESFFENTNHFLSPKSHQFLLETLKETKTGKKSIRGLLPKNAIIAHKTGHSGKNEQGLTAAQNDIGIIFLPNGKHFYLSVFVGDSMESHETNQLIIAQIAKLAWDYFSNE